MTKNDFPNIKNKTLTHPFVYDFKYDDCGRPRGLKYPPNFRESDSRSFAIDTVNRRNWELILDYKSRTATFLLGSHKRVVKEDGEVLEKGFTEFEDVKHLCNRAQFYFFRNSSDINHFSEYIDIFAGFDKEFNKKHEQYKILKSIRGWVHIEGVGCFINPKYDILIKSDNKNFVLSRNDVVYELKKNSIGILSRPANIKFNKDKYSFSTRNYLKDDWFFSYYDKINEDPYERFCRYCEYGGVNIISRDDYNQILKITEEKGPAVFDDEEDEKLARKIFADMYRKYDIDRIANLRKDQMRCTDELDVECYEKVIREIQRLLN